MSWTPDQPPPPPGWHPQAPPPGHGGYTQQVEHPQATTALVVGVLGLVFCQILGPFAWSMGNKALKEIDASGIAYSNRGTIQAGRICGIIASVLMILSLVAFVFFMIAMITFGTTTSIESDYESLVGLGPFIGS